MSKIRWSTDVVSDRPGEIVCEDGRTLMPSTDFEYPSFASTFGWSLQEVQKCPCCKTISKDEVEIKSSLRDDKEMLCFGTDCRVVSFRACLHNATDGTVPCKECGLSQSDFISAAWDWLRDNRGAEAEDPGYFCKRPSPEGDGFVTG